MELRDPARQRHRLLPRAGVALLPGGIHTPAFHEALARESRYFNAHPYLASVAVGALARAELDGADPERIERFRTALCGPLGSVGDRLVWAGWLPFCSLASLAVFGLGASPVAVVALFLVLYNVGHLGLRIWGLNTGWKHGLRVASALGNPVLRRGPQQIGRVAALATGIAIPLALGRIIGPGRSFMGEVLVAVALGVVSDRPPADAHRRMAAVAHRARRSRPLLGDSLMPERAVQIVNKNGLHARPAAEIVKLAAKFQSEITIVKDDLDVNGKSIMGVMMLAAEHGSTILLRAEGPDADAALDALATLVGNKFGER